jgi:DNA-binding transcriptional MerR regulator
MGYSIGEVAKRTGISIDTLRFYERVGLTPNIARTAGGQRQYSDQDLAFLEFAQKMRTTGMPLEALARYVELMKRGIATVPQRRAMLEEYATGVDDRIAALQRAQDALRMTISWYRAIEARETANTDPPPIT